MVGVYRSITGNLFFVSRRKIRLSIKPQRWITLPSLTNTADHDEQYIDICSDTLHFINKITKIKILKNSNSRSGEDSHLYIVE